MSASEAELIAGEAYQVIGDLALAANLYDHPEVQRALDWFSGFEPGVTYKDDASILPWPKEELKPHPDIPRASGVPEAEAVAWRYRPIGETSWDYFGGPWPRHWNDADYERDPLFTAPPPVAAPSGEAWRCFHCDEVFTDKQAAQEHFGMDEIEAPACKLCALEGAS